MNILISGGNGFVGRHIVKQMLSEGHRVYVLYRTSSNLR